MKTLNLFLAIPFLAFATSCNAQDQSRQSGIKNSTTVNVKIDGDCGMCEKTIERVGFVKGESEVDWDVDSHMARVTYDSTRTDLDAILQRVAHAGYDNERFLAPKEAYDKLPGCCQYERTMVHAPVNTIGDASVAATEQHGHTGEGHGAEIPSVFDKPGYQGTPQRDVPEEQKPKDPSVATDHLQPVFDAYFLLKDALVASDGAKAKQAASTFDEAVHGVPMEKLDHSVHMVWMKVMEGLMDPAHAMSKTADIAAQRKAFVKLTDPMAELAKASPRSAAIYRDHCPMYEGGADWLSKEKPIKNPFYGSMMMTCGSVKETIAK